MAKYDEVLRGIRRLAEAQFGTPTEMSRQFKINQSKLSKMLAKTNVPKADFVLELLDSLGVELVWPDEVKETSRPVIVHAAGESSKQGAECSTDYRAIPLLSLADAAEAKNIPASTCKEWCVVSRHIPTLINRKNLVAVRLDQSQRHLPGTLDPGDTAVIDRDDLTVPDSNSGNIFLVRDPWDGICLKRVRTRSQDGRILLILFSDNGEFAPSTIGLDELGDDISRAILGRAVFGRCDLTKK